MVQDEMPTPGPLETGALQPSEAGTLPDAKAAMEGIINKLVERNASEFGGKLCGVLDIDGSKVIAFPDWSEQTADTNDPYRFLFIAPNGYKAIEMDREFGDSENNPGLSNKDLVSHMLARGDSWGVSMNDNAIVFGGNPPPLDVRRESTTMRNNEEIRTDKIRWIPDLPAEDALSIAKARIEDAKRVQEKERAEREESVRKVNAQISTANEISNLLD